MSGRPWAIVFPRLGQISIFSPRTHGLLSGPSLLIPDLRPRAAGVFRTWLAVVLPLMLMLRRCHRAFLLQVCVSTHTAGLMFSLVESDAVALGFLCDSLGFRYLLNRCL